MSKLKENPILQSYLGRSPYAPPCQFCESSQKENIWQLTCVHPFVLMDPDRNLNAWTTAEKHRVGSEFPFQCAYFRLRTK